MIALTVTIFLIYALGNALLLACLALGKGDPLPPECEHERII
jgi:hypothetical protein